MVYLFEVTPMDVPFLVQQVSRGLEARAAFLFRRRHPRLWRLTESRRQAESAFPDRAAASRRYRRLVSLALWLLGVFLAISTLLFWQKMLLPMAAGMLCIAAGLIGLWRYGRSLLIALSLSKGALLFLIALWRPEELQVLLPFASMGVVIGVAALTAVQLPRPNRYDRAAEELLQKSSRVCGVQVSFSMDGMRYLVRSQTGFSLTGVGPIVPYHRFEAVIETEDLFLLIYYEESVTILQKKDLPSEQLDHFRRFIARRTALFRSGEAGMRLWSEEGRGEESPLRRRTGAETGTCDPLSYIRILRKKEEGSVIPLFFLP